MKHLRLIILFCFFCSFSTIGCTETSQQDHQPGIYYTIFDAVTGQILLETGSAVEVGDQLITDDNKFYQVSHLIDYAAYADFLHVETSSIEELSAPVTANDSPDKLIGIYHSHTDESYVPTDGTASIRGNGSIMKVGEAFAEKLQSLGYSVSHDKSIHDPHDANAYIRSRRTASRLLGEQPAALFDIHRNSAPVSAYRLTVNNEPVAKMVIVIGRANPYMPTNLGFAKQLKAAFDAKVPNLIRGIFFAHGHYNQDLTPRSVLVEIGSDGSTLEEAQRTAFLFAEIIPIVLGGSQATAPEIGSTTQAAPPEGGDYNDVNIGSSAWRNLLWLLSIALIGSISYLYISTGSWHGVRQKLRQLRDLEFANLLGLRLQQKNNKPNDSDEQ